ncbi:MAG: hypothetical protein L3J41_11255 [Melioribacteraceae bacterium]|nr:hypothetical protein [Melioribacteraceae bacterium]
MFGEKKKTKHLESLWGKEIERYRDFGLISFYHNYKIKNSEDEFVDDRTWTDLNFNTIFSKIDRNISGIGQQFLFHILHKYEKDESVLKRRIELANVFRKDKKLRESIQIPLLNLTDIGVNFISNIIYGEFPKRPKYPSFFYFMSYLALSSMILSFFNGTFFLLAMASAVVNIIINKLYTDKYYENFIGLSNLNKLIIASKIISKTETNLKIEQLEKLKNKKKILERLNKKLGRFVIDKSMLNEFAVAVIEYGNMVLLFDLCAYLRSVNILKEHLDEIREVFEVVAELDTIISLASYIDETKSLTTPKFVTEKKISFEDLYHPIIEDPVSNSINELNKSALITGSNMAGKTTFIKTVGVNLLLAQTIFLCHASNITTYRFCIKSSIKREDNLENSKSYFFTEIEGIEKFIKLAQKKENYLFLIDEIFRGTNTIERLAASTAVLDFLNLSNRVFVTTHDIELQYLLKNKFDTYHFSEQVSGSKFFFDYKIISGVNTKGNAIKLLEIMKYPEEITLRANKIADDLKEKNPLSEGLFIV